MLGGGTQGELGPEPRYRAYLAAGSGKALKEEHLHLYDPLLCAFAQGAVVAGAPSYLDINMVGIPMVREKFFR